MPRKTYTQRNKDKDRQTSRFSGKENAMSQSHGQIMDHTKMTFAELERFRTPSDVAQRITAVTHSAIIQRIDPAILQIILRYLLSKPRKNQAALSIAEKNNFNAAVQAAISAGTYTTTTAIHA